MMSIKAIMTYFARPDKVAPEGGRSVSTQELKLLSAKERSELGKLACVELGETWEPTPDN